MILQLNVTLTLTFDLKSNRGYLYVVTNHHSKIEDSRLYQLAVIDRKPFDLLTHTLTLTFDLKNNRGHLHVITNHQSKFKDSRLKGLTVIDQKPFDLILQLKVSDLDL